MANETLKKSFITYIRVFSSLIDMRHSNLAGHSHRVADLSRRIANQMGMKDTDVQDVFIAALLHDIGKIGLPDYLLEKPYANLTADERLMVVKHPARGQTALMALEQLRSAAKLIRSHHEHFDGMGYPDGLAGLEIPLGARIIALANEYDALQIGTLMSRRLMPAEAEKLIQSSRGGRYDPTVVDAFFRVLQADSHTEPTAKELALHSEQLKFGMVLSRDLISKNGELLLSKDHMLDVSFIEEIQTFEQLGGKLTIYVFEKE
jgi:putative nucleotidyltransferase with HDIG domain